MSASAPDLAFLPLGGTGEIGMNLNLYRLGDRWLAVDCGIGFGGADLPEVDVMMPDPAFLAERRSRLDGLVITHAHEDHIGAVAWLWRQLRCPVYATPFAAAVLRRKLSEAQLLAEVPLHMSRPAAPSRVGPSSCNSCGSRIPSRKRRLWRSPRRPGSSCTPATGSSIPRRWSGRPRMSRRSRGWGIAACSR